MNIARYSLITMRPIQERVDTVVIGVVVYAEDKWHLKLLPNGNKVKFFDSTFSPEKLKAISGNLLDLINSNQTLTETRNMLASLGSTVRLDEFEGAFAYSDGDEFNSHLHSIMAESVLVGSAKESGGRRKQIRREPIRRELVTTFKNLGLLSKDSSDIDKHKIVQDFPISKKYGLVAEFALKNGVMSITETVDFGVSDWRSKFNETQAKCFLINEAKKEFGDNTKGHIIVSSSSSEKASKSVDLLSTCGDVYALESQADMKIYYEKIKAAAFS